MPLQTPTPSQLEAIKLIKETPAEVLLALVYKLTAGSVNPITVDRIIEAEKLRLVRENIG